MHEAFPGKTCNTFPQHTQCSHICLKLDFSALKNIFRHYLAQLLILLSAGGEEWPFIALEATSVCALTTGLIGFEKPPSK